MEVLTSLSILSLSILSLIVFAIQKEQRLAQTCPIVFMKPSTMIGSGKDLLLCSYQSTRAVKGFIIRCLEVKQTLFLVYCKHGSFDNS